MAKLGPMIFVSYFCGIKGMVMAEWADDKLRVLASTDKKVFVITSLYCDNLIEGNFKYYRIPSFSWRDFKREISELHRKNIKVSIWLWIFFPISLTFGRIFDWLVKKWIDNDNPARWSWAFTSFPIVIYLRLLYKCEKIFCTGGAAGAYLLGCLASFIYRTKIFTEFQDPIIGSEIHRNSNNERLIISFEKFVIKTSYKTIYVTKNASISAANRHPELALKINAVYPGSWFFTAVHGKQQSIAKANLEFIHLGTLYDARNLKNFFAALDQLRLEGFPNAHKVKVKNLGSVNLKPSNLYSFRNDFEVLEPLDRCDALNRCLDSSILLLIQHADNRSIETIPYKTYDYLNLRMPIFGIINNKELEEILTPLGHYVANALDISSIKNQISFAINDYYSEESFGFPDISPFNAIDQFKKLLED